MTPTLTINHMSTKLINLGDAINPTHVTNKRYVDTKTNDFLRTDGMRAMTGDLNMNTRRILNLRQPQSYENTHAVNVGFLKKELSSSNAKLQTIIHNEYEKYVSDRFNHSVSSTDQKNVSAISRG